MGAKITNYLKKSGIDGLELAHELRIRKDSVIYADRQSSDIHVYKIGCAAIMMQDDEIIIYSTEEDISVHIMYFEGIEDYLLSIEDLRRGIAYKNKDIKRFIAFAERRDLHSLFVCEEKMFRLYGLYIDHMVNLEYIEPANQTFMMASLFDPSEKTRRLITKLRKDEYYLLSENSGENEKTDKVDNTLMER
ncbi:MAG: hypothetical protein LUD81_06035 [Clostridiales bacterium]|nr:hypothetical protein [Clostridiales bacterium]